VSATSLLEERDRQAEREGRGGMDGWKGRGGKGWTGGKGGEGRAWLGDLIARRRGTRTEGREGIAGGSGFWGGDRGFWGQGEGVGLPYMEKCSFHKSGVAVYGKAFFP
jgi:hypothetical protein